MNWTTAKDLKVQLTKLWERGELLRDVVSGDQRFPLRLSVKGASSADITHRFESVRAWVSELATSPPLRIEYQEVRHRVQGLQRLPAAAWLDSLDDVLRWLGKRQDWERFRTLVQHTQQACPVLLDWLGKRPIQALALHNDWPNLLAVVNWMLLHPRPGIYLRQVDILGVHSKFIEAHRGVLTELLDLALLPEWFDASKGGVSQFNARYGFRDKPLRIRFRSLDPAIAILPGALYPDVTLDGDSFSRLNIAVQTLLIVENEINFLALPAIDRAVAIFGSGYGWAMLAQARWLERCRLYYWGDIDTHGFAILDQLRGHFSHAESLLMDRTTLLAHQAFWGKEDKPTRIELTRLREHERALYNDLRDNRIAPDLRLEQEQIGFNWIREELAICN